MTAFTKEIEDKIRALGLALKLQLDFTAAADMTQSADRKRLLINNAKMVPVMTGLIRALNLTAASDADYLDAIVKVAESNNSDAGDVLKALVPKVRAINDEVKSLYIQRGGKLTPQDLNAAFRKHLQP